VALIHDGERAEIATVWAAARGKQNSTRMIAPMKQILPRHRGMFQSRGLSGTVPVGMPPRVKVAQELRPVGFSLTDEDYVCMRLRLIWHQSHMRSTQYHRNSPLPEPVCHGIDVRRTRGMESNRHQVRLQTEIDRPHHLIDMEHSPMRRCEGGKIRHGDLLEVQHTGAPYLLDLG